MPSPAGPFGRSSTTGSLTERSKPQDTGARTSRPTSVRERASREREIREWLETTDVSVSPFKTPARAPFRGDPALAFCGSLCRPAVCAAASRAVLDGEENSEVLLHVYDITESSFLRTANQLLSGFGTGAFHVGVEVYGWEWSFGDASEGTGVFYCKPRSCGRRQYRETVTVGTTALSAVQVDSVIRQMEKEWRGDCYNLFRRNCVHFCKALCRKLVRNAQVPPYISSLSGAGELLQDKVEAAQRLLGVGGGEIQYDFKIVSL